MKAINLIKCCSAIAILASSAFAEEHVDRSKRTDPYASTPSYAQGGNSSRYDTSNGWSRSGNNWYWGNRGSDIPNSGYTAPVNDHRGSNHDYDHDYDNSYNNSYNDDYSEQRCGGGRPAVVHPNIAQNSVRPSCGAGTVFDGHGCKITDSRLKRPGGDGYINPCTNGTRFSQGRCIR